MMTVSHTPMTERDRAMIQLSVARDAAMRALFELGEAIIDGDRRDRHASSRKSKEVRYAAFGYAAAVKAAQDQALPIDDPPPLLPIAVLDLLQRSHGAITSVLTKMQCDTQTDMVRFIAELQELTKLRDDLAQRIAVTP